MSAHPVSTPRSSFLAAAPQDAVLRRHVLALPGVRDAVVRQRRDADGGVHALVYMVAETLPGPEDFPPTAGPVTVVPVSALPLTPDGAVDDDALAALPVVTADTAARVSRSWKGAPVTLRQRHSLPPLDATVPAARTGRPSLLAGAELPAETAGRACLGDALLHTARTRGDAVLRFITAPGDAPGASRALTYAGLHRAARCVAAGLAARGLAAGDAAVLQCADAQAFLTALWGMILAGLIPVPVGVPLRYAEGDQTAQRLAQAAALFPDAIVVTEADRAAPLAGFLPGRRTATVEDLAGHVPDGEPARPDPDAPALYLLTSGSTAAPKVVALSHRRLLAHCRAAVAVDGLTPDDVSLNWLPLDHVGGVVMFHLPELYLGATQIHSPTGLFLQDPLRWMDWCSDHRVTRTWAPNFAYHLVAVEMARAPHRSWDLTPLRLALNGGEAIVRTHAEAFLRAMAPHGLRPEAMRPMWGMSETSSMSVLCEHFHRGMKVGRAGPVDVGVPFPGNRVRIVDDSGAVVPEGRIGRLQTTGATVFQGYHRNPAANAASFTADGWFDTGDLGCIEDGQLHLAGRSKDILIVNGHNLDPGDIEARINAIDGVAPSFTAVVAARTADDPTDRVTVFFAPSDPGAPLDPVLKRIRAAIGGGFGLVTQAIVALDAGAVPKTSIGKIQKERLRQALASGALRPAYSRTGTDDATAPAAPASGPRSWRRVWTPKQAQPMAGERRIAVVADGGAAAGLAARLSALLESPVAVAAALAPRTVAASGIEQVVMIQDDGPADALLALIRELGHASRQRPLALTVVATGTQKVGPDDRVVPERTVVIPLLRTAMREYPALACRHLDLDVDPASPAAAAIIAAECGDPAREAEVAHRAGARLVSRLAPADAARRYALAAGGRHVVAGGLGGIGLALCRHLLDRFDSRLVVLGRRREDALPPEARHVLDGLRADGRVAYVTADVADGPALAAAEAAISAHLGPRIDGVWHLAGTLAPATLDTLAPHDFAAELRAKVGGTRALHALACRLDAGTLTLFSSVNGYFGGTEMAAYAAGNRYQEAFALAAAGMPGPRVQCLAWSMWDDTGMGRRFTAKEVSRRQGYMVLSPAEAIGALAGLFGCAEPAVQIGLDETCPPLRPVIDAPPVSLASLDIAVADAPAAGPAPLDAFGTPVPWQPATIPPAATAPALMPAAAGGGAAEVVDTIAGIWRDLLELDAAPGPDDNVFDLGAYSLIMPRLQQRLKDSLQVEVDIIDLFQLVTPRALGAHLNRIAS